MMKRITLDLTHIHTVRALHIYLQYMLDFPAHYGRNLDALHDLLTESDEALCLRIERAKQPSTEMESYMLRIQQVLGDAAEENDRLVIEWI